MKHGTISLIEEGTLVIGVLTQPELYEKTLSNMVECKSRGAYLMGLTTFGHYNIEEKTQIFLYTFQRQTLICNITCSYSASVT